MGSTVDYDKHYKDDPKACGEPFKEIVGFFKRYERGGAKILDLGCGQGRDALMLAQMGHSVIGVDLSEVGIKQMVAEAKRKKLSVQGIVKDIVSYRSREKFDVIILDSVLHLLLDDEERRSVLNYVSSKLKRDGFVLIRDYPNGMKLIRSTTKKDKTLRPTLETKNFLFLQKVS